MTEETIKKIIHKAGKSGFFVDEFATKRLRDEWIECLSSPLAKQITEIEVINGKIEENEKGNWKAKGMVGHTL